MAWCSKLNEKQTKKIEHLHLSFLIFDCGQSVTRHGMHLPLCLPHSNQQNPYQKRASFWWLMPGVRACRRVRQKNYGPALAIWWSQPTVAYGEKPCVNKESETAEFILASISLVEYIVWPSVENSMGRHRQMVTGAVPTECSWSARKIAHIFTKTSTIVSCSRVRERLEGKRERKQKRTLRRDGEQDWRQHWLYFLSDVRVSCTA